jgi:hypothetical protein
MGWELLELLPKIERGCVVANTAQCSDRKNVIISEGRFSSTRITYSSLDISDPLQSKARVKKVQTYFWLPNIDHHLGIGIVVAKRISKQNEAIY